MFLSPSIQATYLMLSNPRIKLKILTMIRYSPWLAFTPSHTTFPSTLLGIYVGMLSSKMPNCFPPEGLYSLFFFCLEYPSPDLYPADSCSSLRLSLNTTSSSEDFVLNSLSVQWFPQSLSGGLLIFLLFFLSLLDCEL